MAHLIIDTREKATLDTIKVWPRKTEFKQLISGDYSCSDNCCLVERKEDDLHEGTFHKCLQQLAEMKHNNPNGSNYLIVNKNLDEWMSEGNYAQRKGFISSVISRGFPPIFVKSHFLMLEIIHGTIQKNHDSKFRGSGEFLTTRRISHRDMALHIMLSLPGIGRKQAEIILKEFGSVMNFLQASSSEIKSVKGIGVKTYDKMMNALCKEVEI